MGIDATRHNWDAEAACLGACFLRNEAAELVCAETTVSDYTQDTYRAIYRAIHTTLSAGKPIDRLTIARALPPDVSPVMLLDLEESVPSAANVRTYLAMVKQASARRAIRAACTRAIAAMDNHSSSVPESIAQLTEDVGAVSCDGDNAKAITPTAISETLKTWMRDAESGVKPSRIQTHLPALNRCLGGGLTPGRLYYLGARPSVGKTSLALDFSRYAAGQGHGVLVISLEMPEVDGITTRALAQESRISELTMRSGLFSDSDYPRMVAGYNRLYGRPLWVTDRAHRLQDIVRCAERWPFTPRLDLLIVDYLQLVRGPRGESRRVETEEISRTLKLLAVTIAAPVLCISALKRRENDDSEPTMSDLKETGELEYDGDAVFLLHRAFNSSEAKLIVAKNKYGPPGSIPLRFQKECVTFEQADEG